MPSDGTPLTQHAQLAEWTTTFSVKAYEQYFQHLDVVYSNDSYMARIRDMQSDYHMQPFVHSVGPSRCDEVCRRPPVDASIAGKEAGEIARGWLGRAAASVPACNRECGVAAGHAQRAFGIDPVHDGLRVIFIKAFKVASTSSASVFYRLAVTHRMSYLGFLSVDNQVGLMHACVCASPS